MPKQPRLYRIPSLQHFSVLLGGSVQKIEKRLDKLGGLPLVSYAQLREQWSIDLIRLGVPIADVKRACRSLRGKLNRECNEDALEAFYSYVTRFRPENLLFIDKVYFPIGRGLQVPVNPAGVVIERGEPKLFWPSFWKKDKFDALTRAAFGTILRRSIFSMADYQGMPLAFVDFAVKEGSDVRGMRVLDLNDFEQLSEAELRRETDKFVAAYLSVAGRKTESEETTAPDTPLFLDHPTP